MRLSMEIYLFPHETLMRKPGENRIRAGWLTKDANLETAPLGNQVPGQVLNFSAHAFFSEIFPDFD